MLSVLGENEVMVISVQESFDYSVVVVVHNITLCSSSQRLNIRFFYVSMINNVLMGDSANLKFHYEC